MVPAPRRRRNAVQRTNPDRSGRRSHAQEHTTRDRRHHGGIERRRPRRRARIRQARRKRGLIARGESGLEATRREVDALGGVGLAVPADVADPDATEAAAEEIEHRFGPLDVWVNDAMATIFAPVLEVRPEEFKRATEVTYLGAVYGTMAALKRMKARDRGTVVQVGSALSYRAIPLQSAYCGSKFALRGFTDSVRTELMHDNSSVWITMVHLPAVNTPQFNWCRTRLPDHPQPVPPIYQPEVPAEAVYWAAHHHRRELDVGASAVKAIIGNKIARASPTGTGAHGVCITAGRGNAVHDRADNLGNPCPLRRPRMACSIHRPQP